MKKILQTLTLSAISTLVILTPVLAKGILTINYANGEIERFSDIDIVSNDKTLYIKTEKNQIIIINKSECKLEKEIQSCSSGQVKLDSYGVIEEINVKQIAVFTNATTKSLQIPDSKVTLSPKTIMVEANTEKGTYVTIMGQIDSNDTASLK